MDKHFIDYVIKHAREALTEADGWNKDADRGPYYTIGAYSYHIKKLIEVLEEVRDESLANF